MLDPRDDSAWFDARLFRATAGCLDHARMCPQCAHALAVGGEAPELCELGRPLYLRWQALRTALASIPRTEE
jgi:hypothetical protein